MGDEGNSLFFGWDPMWQSASYCTGTRRLGQGVWRPRPWGTRYTSTIGHPFPTPAPAIEETRERPARTDHGQYACPQTSSRRHSVPRPSAFVNAPVFLRSPHHLVRRLLGRLFASLRPCRIGSSLRGTRKGWGAALLAAPFICVSPRPRASLAAAPARHGTGRHREA
jgi:hypothetical protein